MFRDWTDDAKEISGLATQMYDCKEKKRVLENQLNELKYKNQYIPKRKKMLRFGFILEIAVLLFDTANIWFWIKFLPFSFFLLAVLAGVFVLLALSSVKKGVFLFLSRNTKRAEQFALRHDLDTLQRQQRKTEDQIKLLQEQIANLDQQYVQLSLEKDSVLQERKKRQDILRKHEVLFDQKPKESAFTIKKESEDEVDVQALYESLKKQEAALISENMEMETSLRVLDKEIMKVNEEFSYAVRCSLIAVIVMLGVAALQAVLGKDLEPIVYMLFSLIFLVGFSAIFIYLFNGFKHAVLEYLLERDFIFIREYAFRNDIIPFSKKRENLLHQKEELGKELDEVRRQIREGL